jgi:hypothetical protein
MLQGTKINKITVCGHKNNLKVEATITSVYTAHCEFVEKVHKTKFVDKTCIISFSKMKIFYINYIR